MEKTELQFEVIERFPDNPIGWLEIKLPKIVMTKLESYIETAKNDPINFNSSLAGNLSKSLTCLLYTSPSPRDRQKSRMPSSA